VMARQRSMGLRHSTPSRKQIESFFFGWEEEKGRDVAVKRVRRECCMCVYVCVAGVRGKGDVTTLPLYVGKARGTRASGCVLYGMERRKKRRMPLMRRLEYR